MSMEVPRYVAQSSPVHFNFHCRFCHIQSELLYSLHDLLLCFLSLHRTRSFSRRLSRCCRTARRRSTSSACRSERPCRPRSNLRTANVPIMLFVFHPRSHLSIALSSHLSLFQLINTAYFMMRVVMDQFVALELRSARSSSQTHTLTHT